MELSKKSQVTVSIDVLETEADFARYVADMLELVRTAVEQGGHDDAVIGACYAIGYLAWQTEDTLRSAARGELVGPQDRSA